MSFILRAVAESAIEKGSLEMTLDLDDIYHQLSSNGEARARVHRGRYLFVLEGWLPQLRKSSFAEAVAKALGPEIVVELVGDDSPRTLSVSSERVMSL